MPPYTSTQKAAISKFVGFTQAKESVATKTLKQHGWNVELAIDAFKLEGPGSPVEPHKKGTDRWNIIRAINKTFFQSKQGAAAAAAAAASTSAGPVSSLNKLFDRYRDNPVHEPDTIGVEGSMRYLADLGVRLDEVAVLVVLTELSAPTMGELNRDGFVQGWKAIHADTLPKQQALIDTFRRSLTHPQTSDPFKKVYKATFLLARTPGQKSLPLDTAVEYWRLLLQSPSRHWTTPSTPWLDWWISFLEERWRKSVSKDMWDQTGIFVLKSLEDEGMGWWSEDGAWPGVLDEFVGYVRERRKEDAVGGVGGGEGGREGDVEMK